VRAGDGMKEGSFLFSGHVRLVCVDLDGVVGR